MRRQNYAQAGKTIATKNNGVVCCRRRADVRVSPANWPIGARLPILSRLRRRRRAKPQSVNRRYIPQEPEKSRRQEYSATMDRIRCNHAGFFILKLPERRIFQSMFDIIKPFLIKPLLFVLIFSPCAQAADEFARVRCGTDIPKALLGQRETSHTIVFKEATHKNIGLRQLGASIIDGKMNTINWLICGREFVILDKGDVIKDLIVFPAHSATFPAFEGRCKINGRQTNDPIVAVLEGKYEPGKFLPARAAWLINRKKAKFIKMDATHLLCPGEGIYTVDGGL